MNFLIANKLWLIVIGGLAGVMLGLGVEIWKLKGDIKDAKAGLARAQTELAIKEAAIQVSAANLGECNMRIDLQNAKFKELEVKKQDAIKEANKAKVKFEKLAVPAQDDECEKKLKFYEDAAAVTAKVLRRQDEKYPNRLYDSLRSNACGLCEQRTANYHSHGVSRSENAHSLRET